jgi:aspartate racemase
MKILGIIGGIAPESTIVYYKAIIADYRASRGDGSYPALIINSIDLKNMIELVTNDRRAELVAHLLNEIGRLADAKADLALIASNTPHLVFDEVRAASPLPLLSIIECARDEAQARGCKRVGLFGTKFTMRADFYPRVFSPIGIEVVTPEPEDQEYIHEKYMGELINGVILPATREGLLNVVRRLHARSGIEALILGGTELPLILTSETAAGVPLLDTTRIHVARAVAELLRP